MATTHIRKTAAVTVEHRWTPSASLGETRRVLSKLAKHAPASAGVALVPHAAPERSVFRVTHPQYTDVRVEWSEWS